MKWNHKLVFTSDFGGDMRNLAQGMKMHYIKGSQGFHYFVRLHDRYFTS